MGSIVPPSGFIDPSSKSTDSKSLHSKSKKNSSQSNSIPKIAKENLRPNGQSSLEPKTPQKNFIPLPRMRKENDEIKAQGSLFTSSRAIAEISKKTPLTPISGDNATDVYITEFDKAEGIKDVVFKPGLEPAKIGEICYGVAGLLNLHRVIAPTKKGSATIIASEDLNKKYLKLSSLDNKPLLVNPKESKQASFLQKQENGNVICKIDSKTFLFTQEGSFYKKSSPLTPFEVLAITTDFDVIFSPIPEIEDSDSEDPEDSIELRYLVPKNQIHEVITYQEKDYVKIGSYFYGMEEDEWGEIELSSQKNIPQNNNQVPDSTVLEKKFSRFDKEDPSDKESLISVIVPTEIETHFVSEKDLTTISINVEDKDYTASKTSEGFYKITLEASSEAKGKKKSTKANKLFTFAHDINNQFFLIPKKGQQEMIREKDQEYIEREEKKYVLRETDGNLTLVRENIDGMVQAKIENTFTQSLNGSAPIDIRVETTARADFYQRIEIDSFIESFLMTILLRPQDGKITTLDQSNVLFQAIPDGEGEIHMQTSLLRPILIDLDETFPSSNTFSTRPDYTDKGNTVHIVRCGLMGFPHARQRLTDDQKTCVINNLQNMVANKGQISLFLRKKLSADKIAATLEVLDKMKDFLDNNPEDWILEDLFFSIFPEYKKQWKMNELASYSPEDKASFIGFSSEQGLKAMKRN